MIQTKEKSSAMAASKPCLHCGTACTGPARFCCAGCEAVYALLMRRGLGHFYEMRDRLPVSPPRPVPEMLSTLPSQLPPAELSRARFHIEGIHCLGCLWLLEKIPALDSRIAEAELDFAHGILEVARDADISWSEVVRLIGELGYTAKPLAEDDGAAARRAEAVREAVRVGVAGFCTGNIMLLAVSVYAGADGALARNFQLLSFALSLPALLYSAWPLYRSAWIPLRNGRISVDLAISLAVLAGFGLSVFNLSAGAGRETYFDSLSMLVFLLLASRYLLNRFRESLAKETPCLSFLSQQSFVRRAPFPGVVRAEALRAGDDITLRAGQILPADARVSGAAAFFDFSLLTGESEPTKLLRGDPVEAGARVLSASTDLEVTRVAAESRLAKILDQIRSFRLSRSPSLDFADRIGRRFVFVVLALATFVTLALPFPEGIHRAIVLVIVTCPCVLAFAVPLAFTRSLQQAARAGILFRAVDKIEDLATARTAFLDKTGTLTTGEFEVQRWEHVDGDDARTRAATLALELKSAHPVGKALARYLAADPLPVWSPDARWEIAGSGVRGLFGTDCWEVLRIGGARDAENLVGVFRNGTLQARAALGDGMRPESAAFVTSLRGLGLEPVILSGDTEARVASVARALGITRWQSGLGPEEKAAIVRATPASLMLGDGANDAVAFQAARVGIAVRGAVELSLQNADVALASPGLESAVRAIRLSRRAMRIVRSNFAISFAYNVLAGSIALAGGMQPLLAAVLMPLSALSVFVFTQVSTKGASR